MKPNNYLLLKARSKKVRFQLENKAKWNQIIKALYPENPDKRYVR